MIGPLAVIITANVDLVQKMESNVFNECREIYSLNWI